MSAQPGDPAAHGPAAILECRICWAVYDPAEGDAFRQVLPGTPFSALPDDWTCPNCDAPRASFLLRADPDADALAARIATRAAALEADFREIWHAKMRDVPLCNKALHVEAVGFVAHEGRALGVLVAPWCMNLVMLPAEGEDWSTLTPGTKEEIVFPSGIYEFLHNVRPMVGGYKACSLFSPMGDFPSQLQVVEVARAVMTELFRPENRDETDRAAEIRAARVAELAPPAPAPQPSRRAVISGGLAAGAPGE
ncbi:[NiFe]-hydrogenase assembly chaperone HybE [Rhodovulum strictum]|uniref:[NiFe]-hydrogenase assembly chaperone HybE n=1 Tax=Rhodovulum strictum TaxID=58314 RepID=A0A844BHW6_9RHOB|nr:[NiFe]-hydrogenase assembly chaperone HybE [Rhodovulum strictum]MRH20642.1 [NiFe]-hydrogenase assembly chaperone HybE [Rhodovulum strictum]